MQFLNKVPQKIAKEIPIDQMVRGTYQPRQQFDQKALQELADTIKNVGIIEPIIVRPKSSNSYEIIAGERRWRAAQIAGLELLPCLVVDYSDEQAIKIALIENISRQNLNPIEEAHAIFRLIDEFQYTHEEAANELGKSRTEISNLLRLLKLDSKVRTLMISGDLSEAHGKLLAGLPTTDQYEYAHLAVVKGWSSRALEKAIRQGNLKKSPSTNLSNPDKHIERMQRQLSELLGAPVKIETEKNYKGHLKVSFTNLDELEGILERVGYKYDTADTV